MTRTNMRARLIVAALAVAFLPNFASRVVGDERSTVPSSPSASEPRPDAEPLDEDEFPLALESDADVDAASSASTSSWAKFPVGSWARRRATSVSYEDGRPVQSVTETKILLKSVDWDKKRYELQYESTIKLGAVDFSRKSETVAYDFWDVPVDDDSTVEELAPVALKIGLKAIPCRTRRVSRNTDKVRETTTVWYSPVVAPHIFQRQTIRESKLDDGASESGTTSRELYVVQRLPAIARIGIAPPNYVARSSSVSGSRKLSTSIVFSPSIPGGSLRENTQETRSADDPVVYQTDSVLLDYYIARPNEDSRRALSREE